jgi:hypothetical protein
MGSTPIRFRHFSTTYRLENHRKSTQKHLILGSTEETFAPVHGQEVAASTPSRFLGKPWDRQSPTMRTEKGFLRQWV